MSVFHFKAFSVSHDKTSHKIGTDAVLLGAWASITNKPTQVLDIGSGSGIIALMMAQRIGSANIDAVEIDSNAYEECVDNFENSPWSDRLFCYHYDVKAFAEEMDEKYDIIVCNPPFFVPDKILDNSRAIARSQITLTYKELITAVSHLLASKGEFSIIIPFDDHEKITKITQHYNLKLQRITHVKGHKEAPYKRCLLQFGFENKKILLSELILETSRHQYTEAYKSLVEDFYLKL